MIFEPFVISNGGYDYDKQFKVDSQFSNNTAMPDDMLTSFTSPNNGVSLGKCAEDVVEVDR